VVEENIDDAACGLAIPERRDAAGFAIAGEIGFCRGDDFCRVSADEEIGALRNGDGALGIFAQGEARDAECGGFFLNAARVSEDQGGLTQETEKIEIADWRNDPEIGAKTDAGLGEALLGARVDWKNDGKVGSDGVDGA